MTDSSLSQPDLSQLKIDRSAGRVTSPWGMAPKVLALLVTVAVAWGAWETWKSQSKEENAQSSKPMTPQVFEVGFSESKSAAGVSGNGYIIARRRAALSTVLSGRLVEIHVEEGTQVKKGQVVARIQFDDYLNAVQESKSRLLAAQSRLSEIEARSHAACQRIAQARSALEVNKAQTATTKTNLEEAIRNRERNRKSYVEKDVSEADWDQLVTTVERLERQLDLRQAERKQIESTIETAVAEFAAITPEKKTQEAEIKTTRAQVAAASILLEKTFIRAPFDGVIVNKGAEEGEVVAATGAGGNSKGSVATLVDLSTLEVQVELPETRLNNVSENQTCKIYLDVEKTRPWTGHVRQIWPTANRGKGTVELRIVFDERPKVLRPEMGCRVVFLNQTNAGSSGDSKRPLWIPTSALVNRKTKPCVWMIKNGTLSRQAIVLGDTKNSMIEVREGLSPGDRIVNRPKRSLNEGDRF